MTFTYKLSKRLAILRPLLIVAVAFGCATEFINDPDRQLAQLYMVPESVTVGLNQTYPLSVYGELQSGEPVRPEVRTIAWTSDNDLVATVSPLGVVTSIDSGTATITALSNGRSAHSRIRVKPGQPPPPPPPPPPPLPPGVHAGWHVAPDGSSSGAGTTGSPWSLSYALSGAAGMIEPGDTVWLHGGTYRGKYTATVAGIAGQPVVIRQYPGERATIDVAGSTSTTSRGDAFVVKGAWTVWWGFEIMSSDLNRNTDTRPNMMINSASNTKYVHLIVHDGGIGFYNYPSASNVEFNGNIIYNNGWQGTAKGGGHALYLKSA